MRISRRARMSVVLVGSLFASGAFILAGGAGQVPPADGEATERATERDAAVSDLRQSVDRLAEEAARLRREVDALHEAPVGARPAAEGLLPAPTSEGDGTAIVEIGRLQGHTSWPSDVAYSFDGLRAVSSASDGTVRVWDLPNRREVVQCQMPNVFVSAVALSANGVHAVSTEHEQAIVWNVQTAEEVTRLPERFQGTYGLAISPDGTRALVTGNGTDPRQPRIVLFDVATGTAVRKMDSAAYQNAMCVAFSPRGGLACSGHVENSVVLWDLETGRAVQTFQGHTDHVLSVAFSPDGTRILSGGTDGTVRLWSVEGDALGILNGHPNDVNEVCFLPDGERALSAGADGTLRLWDLEAGVEVTRADIFIPINAAAVSPDGTHAICTSLDGDLIVWRLPRAVEEMRTLRGHSARVSCVALSADGATALTGGQDHQMILWDLAAGREIRRFEGHKYWVTDVAILPDGQRAMSASFDKTLRLWDLESGRELRRIDAHPLAIESVDIGPDGVLAISGSRDMTAGLWNLQTGEAAGTLAGHVDIVRRASFSPDGSLAFTVGGNDPTIRLWDVATWTVKAELHGHLGWVSDAVFSSDGRHILSASVDSTIRLWEVESGREVRRFGPQRAFSPSLQCAALAADGRRALSGDQLGNVALWDVETGRRLASVDVATDVNALAFTPGGGQAVLACGDHCVRIWRLPGAAAVTALSVESDAPTGYQRGKFTFAPHAAMSVAFSPDGRTLAVGTAGKTVELCDVETLTTRASLAGHAMPVFGVAFSPDGEFLASAGGGVRLWDARSGAEIAMLQAEHWSAALVAFSPDGQTLVGGGGNSGNVTVWDVPTREARGHVTHGSHGVSCVSFSPDGDRFATGGRQGEVQIWETATRRNLASLKTPDFGVLFVGPSGLLATTGDVSGPAEEESVTIWAADLQTVHQEFATRRPGASVLAASPDGRIIATAKVGGVVLWDADTGRELHSFEGHVGSVVALAFSPDGRLLASASHDQTVVLWNVPQIPGTAPDRQ